MQLSVLMVLAAVALANFAAPFVVEAQLPSQVPRVGILTYSSPLASHTLEVFRQGLRAFGYVEGQTVMFDQRSAMGREARLPDLANELLSGGVAVLVTGGPYSSVVAKRATTSVPIVFVAAHSPVELGLVASIPRPGGNVTGIAWNIGPEQQAKQMQLLKEAMPQLRRVAFLFGAANSPERPAYLGAMEAGALQLGVKLHVVNVAKAEEYDASFRAIIANGAKALVVAGNARNFVHRKRIIDFAASRQLPAAYAWREAVEDGGLLSYGPNITDLYGRAAVHVAKILGGAKPADLPVEMPTKFELVINMKTAKALGVTLPRQLLLQADQVFE